MPLLESFQCLLRLLEAPQRSRYTAASLWCYEPKISVIFIKNKQTNLLQYLKWSLYVSSSVRTYCFMHIVWPVNAKELQVCKIWPSVCAILRLMEMHLLPQITELLFKVIGHSCTDAAVGREWSHLMSDFTRHAQLKKQAKSHGWVSATASAASISASSSSVCHTFHIYCFRRCVNLLQKSFTTVGRRKLRESRAKHSPQMERFVDKCCWRQATLRAIWQERFPGRARKTDGAPSFNREPLRRRNRPVLTWTDFLSMLRITRRLIIIMKWRTLTRLHHLVLSSDNM